MLTINNNSKIKKVFNYYKKKSRYSYKKYNVER